VSRAFAGIGLGAILATACTTAIPSVEASASATEVMDVPLAVAPGAGLGAGPQGGCGSVAFSDLRVHGDQSRSPAVWVVAVDGGAAHAIRWPPGFSARFEPTLVIYDARGRPVARDGDLLANASGYPQSDRHPMTLFSFNGVDYPCE
jgi:hypothetical protein